MGHSCCQICLCSLSLLSDDERYLHRVVRMDLWNSEVGILLPMVNNMKEDLKIMPIMEQEQKHGQMVESILVNGEMINKTDKELLLMQMVQHGQVNGKTTTNK